MRNPITAGPRRDEVEANPLPDGALVTRIAAGDASALAEMYDAYGGVVYTLALRVMREAADAEDVVQEVFAQAWRQAGRYDRSRATVAGWLLMMARARALDALRKRRARPDVANPAELPQLAAAADSQEALIISNEDVARVRTALGALDDSVRVPIELAYYEGLSQSEIATRLDQPLGTVKTRMRGGLARLRAALWPEGSR